MLSNNTMYVALPVRDLDEAMEFYGNTLGLTMVDRNERGVWYKAGTSRIVVYPLHDYSTIKNSIAIWEVGDPRATMKSLRARGVRFVKLTMPGAQQDGYINSFPSYDAAYFNDPSGNLICLTHHL